MVETKRRHDPLARLDRWCYIKIGGGKPPPQPDPAVQTAQEAAANRYNINSPFGSQTWSQGARGVIGYDSNNQPIYGHNYPSASSRWASAARCSVKRSTPAASA